MSFFISDAWAEGAGGSAAGGDPLFLLWMLALFGAFYFFLIRPQMKQQKKHAALVSSLTKGMEVLTAGGIAGRIVNIKEDSDFLVLEVADGVNIKVRKGTIETELPKGTLKDI